MQMLVLHLCELPSWTGYTSNGSRLLVHDQHQQGVCPWMQPDLALEVDVGVWEAHLGLEQEQVGEALADCCQLVERMGIAAQGGLLHLRGLETQMVRGLERVGLKRPPSEGLQ